MATPDALDSADSSSSPPARKPRSRRWLRALAWIVGGLLLLAIVAVGAGVLWLRSREMAALPVLDGEVRLTALSGPAVVRRDAHGVPHIEAASQDDLFVAQGYVTAQDRLWQMDLYRRNANGELAEILGSALVNHDVAQRVLGFG
jgi:penicillin amidase